MPPRLRRSVVVLLVLSVAAPAAACLWDYDTLQMERERFPGALELIVGKFLRHTDEFYEWRVKDRRAKFAAHDAGEKTLDDGALARAYDDLAAGLDKLKKHDEAIATIREKAERLPKVGEYETHANLGTFLVHSGRLEEGVAELKKAIEINPEAHFGREKYQIAFVEYLLYQKAIPTEPIDARSQYAGSPRRHHNFAEWVLKHHDIDVMHQEKGEQAEKDEIDRALKGVLGMMRFGDYRSPALLEAAGDLLNHRSQVWVFVENKGQRLAARAYLRAAELTTDPLEARRMRIKFKNATLAQFADTKNGELVAPDARDSEGISSAQLTDQLHREVKEADAWFATTIAHDEELWVKESPDPDRRFWEKYGGQEIRVGHDRLPPAQFARAGLPWALRAALGGAAVVTVAAVVGALYWRRRRPTGYGDAPRQR